MSNANSLVEKICCSTQKHTYTTQRQRIRADQHSIALYDTKQSQEKQNKAGVVLHGMAWHEVLLLFRSILIRLHRLLLTFDRV